MNLAEFLLARIADDEAAARKVQEAAANAFGGDPDAWIVVGMDDATGVDYNPARVLAECDAKRRIVAWHRLIDGLDTEDNPVRGCGSCIASGAVPPYLIAGPCMTLRLLALPYADHPDYREEWRP